MCGVILVTSAQSSLLGKVWHGVVHTILPHNPLDDVKQLGPILAAVHAPASELAHLRLVENGYTGSDSQASISEFHSVLDVDLKDIEINPAGETMSAQDPNVLSYPAFEPFEPESAAPISDAPTREDMDDMAVEDTPDAD